MNIKQFLLFASLAFVFFYRSDLVYAIDDKVLYFSDNFSSLGSNWGYYAENSNISTDDRGLTLSSSNSQTYPFVYTIENIIPTEGDYEINIKYSYPSTSDFGVGFGFGNIIPSYGMQDYSNPDLFRDWVYFYVWQGLNDNHTIYSRNCTDNSICSTNIVPIFSSVISSLEHELTIRYRTDHFEVIHNNVEIENSVLINSKRRPSKFWIGNPIKLQTKNNWSTINIKSLSVYRISQQEPSKTPVIVLPGFGGSWDILAILSGTSGGNWKIPPFVKEYDGIINSLKNSGYVEDDNLFVFPYDWRKNLSSLATDLNNFIQSKNLGNKRINIVGHSMGGLVARSYLQSYNNQNIEKLVTVGSPHKGIIDAYALWEGGMVWDGVWWQKVLLEIASELNRKQGETKIQAIRRVAPAIKDLMPTEDFLRQNSSLKQWGALTYKNDYLKQKNVEISPFLSQMVSGGSDDNSYTKSEINVENNSREDRILGLWTDGKPKVTNPFLFSLGDGFVTNNSATNLFSSKLDLSGGHGETISKKENIVKILSNLGIATESAVGSNADNRKRAFVAKLNSPGKLFVCLLNKCNSELGVYLEEQKLLIIPGYNNENYSISVKALGEMGNYELVVGDIDDSGKWKKVRGSLSSNSQVDNYFYTGQTKQISSDSKTMDNNLKVYWPKKIRLSDVYSERQKILEKIEKDLKVMNTTDFDQQIEKWYLLDYFVASEHERDKGFGHDDWDKGIKRIKESKLFAKTNNYFSATLVSLLKSTEEEYKLTPYWKVKLKVDKFIQIAMLKGYMGL